MRASFKGINLPDKHLLPQHNLIANLVIYGTFLRFAIAADFNIRMIVVKVRQYRQGYPLTKINVLAYRISNCMKNVPKLMQFDIK